jgi:uncharacterized phage protein (TIGR01671 family)
MREIKFRAWERPSKEMIYSKEGRLVIPALVEWRTSDFCLLCHVSTGRGHFVTGHSGTLMQFTGLKDKNGKEIYEGDIIRNSMQSARCGYVIEWWDGRFRAIFYNHGERIESINYSTPYFDRTDDVEVIGNIYENPELIK